MDKSAISRWKPIGLIVVAAAVIIVFLVVVFSGSNPPEVSVAVEEDTDAAGRPLFLFEVSKPADVGITFLSTNVFEYRGRYAIYANNLHMGQNVLEYLISRDEDEWVQTLEIENDYVPIRYDIDISPADSANVRRVRLALHPDDSLFLEGAAPTEIGEGVSEFRVDGDTVLEGHDPDLTPTVRALYPLRISNASGNILKDTISLRFSFPRVDIRITEPYGKYVSRTGSGYTIRGTGERGTDISVTGAYNGTTSIGWNDEFAKWVSVPEFGENYYLVVGSREGMTSDTALVTINREMTEDEMISEYKSICRHIDAEYLAQNHSSLIGDDVRVWGLTVEYFGNQLHLVNGGYHWIADLSGFERIPRYEGMGFYCWGEVSADYRSFQTSGGDDVYAPVVEAMYYEVSY